MQFFIIIFIFTKSIISDNVGTTIFHNRHPRTECWNEDDLAKLRARKAFDQIIPPAVTPDKVNTKYIKDTLRYYHKALRSVEREINVDYRTAELLKEALVDTIGAHLRSEILPTVRFAYYAGYVPYRQVRHLHDFLDGIKEYLNSQGLGWKRPDRVPQWSNLTVVKILIGSGKLLDPCSCLITKRDANSCIHLPSPKLDDYYDSCTIALPFKSGGLITLSAPRSENILLKYYTTAARCILRSSPVSCRHSDFVNFNNELWHWMKRDVAPHLTDEKLYAAYGGVLRVAAAVQNYGKGLSRRNLFEEADVGTLWRPWKSLTNSYIYLNTDWTPQIYIAIVFLIIFSICSMQMFYGYIFGGDQGCGCAGKSQYDLPKVVSYNKIESSFPAMLPSDQSPHEVRRGPTPSRTKRSSSTSAKTQRVYDLNENTEKLMAVIMSDDDSDRPGDKRESEEDNVIDVGQRRPRSPPKLETPVTQLRIEKTPRGVKKRVPMYCSSTVTRSEVTFCQKQGMSESTWTGSASSSSERSLSSVTSKSQARQSRSSRDLAWARRVVSKHSLTQLTRSTSGTELEMNSYTTPPSQR